MKKIQIRPRIRFVVPFTPEETLNRIRSQIEKDSVPFTGTFRTGYATIRIPEDEQHYWSPELTIGLEKHEKGTLVRGLFGPKPAVWTLFASFYALSSFVGFIGLMWGSSQWSLGLSPYALWAVPIAILLLGSAYAIAYVGQKLGHEQIETMQAFLKETLAVSGHQKIE